MPAFLRPLVRHIGYKISGFSRALPYDGSLIRVASGSQRLLICVFVKRVTHGCRFGANSIPSWNKGRVASGPALYYIE